MTPSRKEMSLEGARWLLPDWKPTEPSDPAGKLIVVRLAELQAELEAKGIDFKKSESEKKELEKIIARAEYISQKLIDGYITTATINAPQSEVKWKVVAIRKFKGDSVDLFQSIVLLESSGTTLDICTNHAGLVVKVLVGKGDEIEPGAPIIILAIEKSSYPVVAQPTSQPLPRPDPDAGLNIAIDDFSVFSNRWSKNHLLADLPYDIFIALSGPLKKKINFTPQQLNELNGVGKTFLSHEQLKKFYSERRFIYPYRSWLTLKNRGHFRFSDLSNAKLDELSGIPIFRRVRARRKLAKLIRLIVSSKPFLYTIAAGSLICIAVFLKFFGLTILAGAWSLLKWLTSWI